MTADSDVLVDYKSLEGARVTHIRSTLIASSIQTLRQQGLLERYLRALPKDHHDVLLAPQAPCWMPVELAEIHYTSCEEMQLSQDESNALWATVTSSVANTVIAQFLRSSRVIGGNPWQALAQSERLYSRLKRGGAVRVTRRGPKEALIESRGCTLYRIPYFASGYSTMLRNAALLFAKTAYARVLTAPDLEHRVVVAWV